MTKAARAHAQRFARRGVLHDRRLREQREAEVILRLGVVRVGGDELFEQRQRVGVLVLPQQRGDAALQLRRALARLPRESGGRTADRREAERDDEEARRRPEEVLCRHV
ncbi:MAG: hypothetical protein LC746_13745 [Acidobacteria bacterium]|nr:hypothetical protein [Acidobacteriota bacterium]